MADDGGAARKALADLWSAQGTALLRCSLDHQQVLTEVWTQAGRAYAAAAQDQAVQGQAIQGQALDPKQAMALWTEIANRTMLEAQRSDGFLVSQRALMRAGTELCLAQSQISEQIGKKFGLPTRSELDDVHRSLTEMRRELRRTRRELDALKAGKPRKEKLDKEKLGKEKRR